MPLYYLAPSDLTQRQMLCAHRFCIRQGRRHLCDTCRICEEDWQHLKPMIDGHQLVREARQKAAVAIFLELTSKKEAEQLFDPPQPDDTRFDKCCGCPLADQPDCPHGC